MNRRQAFFIGLLLAAVPASPAAADLWAISEDSSISRVIRFDNHGNELPGGIPSFSAGLVSPGGIAVGPDGNIYVSSRGTGQILFYNSTTGAPLTLPGAGLPAGVFANVPGIPAQLKFGPDGKLYMSQIFGTEVWAYNRTNGTHSTVIDGLEPVTIGHALAFGPDGALYVGDGLEQGGGTGARIYRVADSQKQVYGTTNTPGGLYSPAAMQFLPSGDLLVVDLANFVARFDSGGQNETLFASPPPPIAPPGTHYPSDIVYDPDGNLILGVLGEGNPPNNLGELVRYDLNGGSPLEIIKDHLEQIGGLAWTASPDTTSGNYDGVGGVTMADYAKWKSDFGKVVAPGNGADGNDDGVVDAADYLVWRDHFSPGGGAGALGAVPEPTSLTLLVLGGLLAIGARMTGRLNRGNELRAATFPK